jgi:hypothetical protein
VNESLYESGAQGSARGGWIASLATIAKTAFQVDLLHDYTGVMEVPVLYILSAKHRQYTSMYLSSLLHEAAPERSPFNCNSSFLANLPLPGQPMLS